MSIDDTSNAVLDPLTFTVADVMHSQEVELTGVDGFRPAGDVAATAATELGLMDDTPWALRESQTARLLVEDQAIGAQIHQGASLVLMPRSHLAAGGGVPAKRVALAAGGRTK